MCYHFLIEKILSVFDQFVRLKKLSNPNVNRKFVLTKSTLYEFISIPHSTTLLF